MGGTIKGKETEAAAANAKIKEGEGEVSAAQKKIEALQTKLGLASTSESFFGSNSPGAYDAY